MSQDANQDPPRPPPPQPPPDPEDPKQIQQLITQVSKPFADQLDHIDSLFLVWYSAGKLVRDAYRTILDDIESIPNDAPSLADQPGVPTFYAHRRVYRVLINLSRLFNPRRLEYPLTDLRSASAELADFAARQDEWRPMMSPATNTIIQLVLRICNGCGYVKTNGQPLLPEYGQLMRRVEAGVKILEAPDRLWEDLQAFRARFGSFLREFLNPELFEEAGRQLAEQARARNDQQAS